MTDTTDPFVTGIHRTDLIVTAIDQGVETTRFRRCVWIAAVLGTFGSIHAIDGCVDAFTGHADA